MMVLRSCNDKCGSAFVRYIRTWQKSTVYRA